VTVIYVYEGIEVFSVLFFLINHITLSLCANHETGSIYYVCIFYFYPACLSLRQKSSCMRSPWCVSVYVHVCVCVCVLADLHEI